MNSIQRVLAIIVVPQNIMTLKDEEAVRFQKKIHRMSIFNQCVGLYGYVCVFVYISVTYKCSCAGICICICRSVFEESVYSRIH